MNSLRAAVVVVAGLLVALWWGVRPPRHVPEVAGPVGQSQQAQCPANSEIRDKQCTCPESTSWTGSQCMQVWSSADATARR
ncbi:hypothetical protein [Massilia cavernae]|uniref:Uncharacterized protein n=1 Tax=Massilia cavernae TaxID=2320864 RepID=A0A418XA83_9BURK|nr:hypothetical protein [Massilia cavernae]RJG09415.1 hypothetical protein D3872_22805 [Massilia cavernae]